MTTPIGTSNTAALPLASSDGRSPLMIPGARERRIDPPAPLLAVASAVAVRSEDRGQLALEHETGGALRYRRGGRRGLLERLWRFLMNA